MKPLKVKRSGGSFRVSELSKKQIFKFILAIVLALVVVSAAFFAVYALSRSISEASEKEDDPGPELLDGVTTEAEIPCGGTCMLTLPDGVDVRDVVFSSSDESIVRVDPSGRVDGLEEGSATVKATSFNFTASCEFTVGDPVPKGRMWEISTAYRANIDLLKENIKKSRDNLYHITVNRRTNTVTVFTYDENGNYVVPVRAMVCSCGYGGAENTTPTGDFKTASMREWATLFGDETHEFVYGQYATEFNNEILFHSVPYEAMEKNSLETAEFNKLGTNASQGCVRMMVADCYWIYKNCPLNTPVSVIDADASADPLGTPPTVKLNSNLGWDPTDPDENNPFKGKLPRILDLEDVTVKKGAKFDPLEGITAKDICGNYITDRLQVTGEVMTEKAGTYYLTYSITDDFGLSRTATRAVTVK